MERVGGVGVGRGGGVGRGAWGLREEGDEAAGGGVEGLDVGEVAAARIGDERRVGEVGGEAFAEVGRGDAVVPAQMRSVGWAMSR